MSADATPNPARPAEAPDAERKTGARRLRPLHLRKRTPPGAPPGTLIADAAAPPPLIHVMSYTADSLDEFSVTAIDELQQRIRKDAISWVDVQGLGDLATIQKLGELFGLHPLALEDILQVQQRPKVERYPDHVFIVTRTPQCIEDLETDQLAVFLGESFVLTFQEKPGDCFDPVRRRLRESPRGRMRSSKPDYLAYALLDTSVDGFFPMLEKLGEIVEDLEHEVIDHPEHSVISRIHAVKRDLLAMRRALWPQREMINALIRDELPFIEEQTKTYLRDTYDHAVQLVDILEIYRELSSGLVEVYLSSVNARMNEVMKILTIISTIFIPLGFVASVYGMNFNTAISPWNMPELNWPWGYPVVLAIMLSIASGLLLYFRRKGWIGGKPRPPRRRRPKPRG